LPEIELLSFCQPTCGIDADGTDHTPDNESENEANIGRIE